MRLPVLLLLALPLSVLPAWAEPTAAQKTKVAALWEKARDSWSPVLTCAAPDRGSDALLHGTWLGTRDGALAAMATAGWPKAELDALRASTEIEQMRLPLETRFADVIAYCTRHKDWVDRANRIDVVRIDQVVEAALKSKGNP